MVFPYRLDGIVLSSFPVLLNEGLIEVILRLFSLISLIKDKTRMIF